MFDQDEVLWAICSRCDPATDIHILENCWSTSLDPVISPEKRENDDLTNSHAIIDATRPYHWIDEFPDVNGISPELENRLGNQWAADLDARREWNTYRIAGYRVGVERIGARLTPQTSNRLAVFLIVRFVFLGRV